MYRKVRSHINIYSEVLMCREALLVYQESLRTTINSTTERNYAKGVQPQAISWDPAR